MAFYDFNAAGLAARRFNPQLQHMGMMEFHINDLVPGGREILILGLSNFNLPAPREIPAVSVPYLNGNINYPGKPGPIGTLTCVFTDYIDGGQRRVLHQLFDYVYDERSGIGGLPSDIKIDAHAVLFGQNGVETLQYYMEGLWLMNDPGVPNIDFAGSGNIITIDTRWSVDFIHEEVINGENFGNASGTLSSISNAAARVGAFNSAISAGAGGFAGQVTANIN